VLLLVKTARSSLRFSRFVTIHSRCRGQTDRQTDRRHMDSRNVRL